MKKSDYIQLAQLKNSKGEQKTRYEAGYKLDKEIERHARKSY